MLNKELIHDRFAKNLKSYDENAKIQKRMAERLITFVQKKQPQKILEIGCGTGFLTELINKNLQFELYKAIDIVEECKDFVKKINPAIIFTSEDVEDFIKTNDEKFDLIISNATLQWISEFKGVINSLKERLNPQGELVFSTFGNENFREIYHVMGTTLNYYSLSELSEMFPNSLIVPEIHIMAFKSPKDVLKHLQLTGVHAIENKAWTKKDLLNFENGYTNLCVKRPTLTYNPIYIRIISPFG